MNIKKFLVIGCFSLIVFFGFGPKEVSADCGSAFGTCVGVRIIESTKDSVAGTWICLEVGVQCGGLGWCHPTYKIDARCSVPVAPICTASCGSYTYSPCSAIACGTTGTRTGT